MRVPAYTVQIIMRVVCMSEKKRTWNEKWKLVLNELEEKISTEGKGAEENRKTRGERPERERSLKSKKGRKYEKSGFQTGNYATYCDVSRFSADYDCTDSGNCQSASGFYYGQQYRKRKGTPHLLC